MSKYHSIIFYNKNKECALPNENYTRRERFVGKYSRSLQLPNNVDEDKITSRYENGVLEVCIPKSDKVLVKKIEIN
jgi:HSP20 family protein